MSTKSPNPHKKIPKKPSSSSSPSLPFLTRLKLAIAHPITDCSRRTDGTVNRRLLSLLDFPTRPTPKPLNGVRSLDVHVDTSRNLWFRLFLPTTPTDRPLPVIVFFHGGGFAFISPATWAYNAVCRRLCRKTNSIIVSVNYRLSPEHRCPAQYDDGLDVLRFLDANGVEGGDLSRCFLAGDSAGGNICHHVGVRWAGAGGWGRVDVRGLFLIQPFFGGEERTESEVRLTGMPLVSVERTDWLWRAFLPEGEDRDHEAVNVFGPRGRGRELPERMPEVAVVVGGFDPLRDWQMRYYEEMARRGKKVRLIWYEKAIHAFYVFPEIKESGMMMEEMRRFIEELSV